MGDENGSDKAQQHRMDELDKSVLAIWEQEKTFEESLKQREHAPRYSFYDGPPYATGTPHYGHILQTATKDAMTRYWTMRGFRVDRRVGWDCHGLPVENLVEKELGLKQKKDIEVYGIEQFNAACRATVFRYVNEFEATLKRLGRWADYTKSYATLEPDYMESVWWTFRQAWDAGLVYQGFRSSPYCPRCATPLSNFETAQGYKDTNDPAITFSLKLTDTPDTYLLVWTTTPWTLPGNVAVAINPNVEYVDVEQNGKHFLLAANRVAAVFGEEVNRVRSLKGEELLGKTYEPLYTFVQPEEPAYRVVAGSFVSAEDGTGIVHIAPAFGEDDLETAKKEELPILHTVAADGTLLSDITPWAGMFVKDADTHIVADLQSRGLLFRTERIVHSYPFCWRCDTPLIYYATTSWFIAVSKIRDELLANNEKIHWVPEHVKHGRFGQGLADAPDWAVSRSRYWSTPMPIWVCSACKKETVVGSKEELSQYGADLTPLYPNGMDRPLDFHRPYIDTVVFPCPACGKEARRVPDVFDVWMDSGAMPYAQWHYPFENKDLVEKTFPADFIAEALDQTRGWFYVLHVLSAIVERQQPQLQQHQPAFLNVIASGYVLAEDGKKLSKRLKNFPDVMEAVQQYGADTIRLYFLAATIGENILVSDRLLREFYRKTTAPLLNVLSFYDMYAKLVGWKPTGRDAVLENAFTLLDEWMWERTKQLSNDVREALDAYQLDSAARAVAPFIDDLSNWYVRRNRKRFSVQDRTPDAEAAYATLHDVLEYVACTIAPMMPFLSEAIVRRLGGNRSPHVMDFPEKTGVQQERLERMAMLRNIVSGGLQARAAAQIKVRQPLSYAEVGGYELRPEEQEIFCDEVNVKEVRLTQEAVEGDNVVTLPNAMSVRLETTLTSELRQEGIARDIIRHVQDLRKKSGLTIQDTIILSIVSESSDVVHAVEQWTQTLSAETKAVSVTTTEKGYASAVTVQVQGATVTLCLEKSS